MINAQIENVGGTVLAHGYWALRYATVRNVAALYVDDIKALNGAVIISDGQSGSTFIAIINGMYSLSHIIFAVLKKKVFYFLFVFAKK